MFSCIGQLGFDIFRKHRTFSVGLMTALVISSLILLIVSLAGGAASSWHTINKYAWTHGGTGSGGIGYYVDYGLRNIADSGGRVVSYQNCQSDDFYNYNGFDESCVTSCQHAGNRAINAGVAGIVFCGISLLLVVGQLVAAAGLMKAGTEAPLKSIHVVFNIAAIVSLIAALAVWNNDCVRDLPESFGPWNGLYYLMKYHAAFGVKLFVGGLVCLGVTGILNLLTPVNIESQEVVVVGLLTDNVRNKGGNDGAVVAVATGQGLQNPLV